MLILEDEKEILEANYPTIIPLLVTETDGDIEIEAYAGIEEIATEFHGSFHNRYFTKEAIDWLDQRLLPYVESLGYLRECTGKYRWYRSFSCQNRSSLQVDCIRRDSVLLSDGRYDSLLSFPYSEQLEKGLPSYVSFADGKLVSIATVNEHTDGQKMLELTVETAIGYRGRGLGLSNIVALADYLLENGYYVSYNCSRYNRASCKLAVKAGLEQVGRFYAYAAYKL
jgi:hypothetical protein